MLYFCVIIPSAVRPYSFTTDGYGIFNVRKIVLGACRTDEDGSDTNKSAQELTRRDIKKHCFSPCPARGSNPGSLDLNSDALTTELRPPVKTPTDRKRPFTIPINKLCSYIHSMQTRAHMYISVPEVYWKHNGAFTQTLSPGESEKTPKRNRKMVKQQKKKTKHQKNPNKYPKNRHENEKRIATQDRSTI